MKTYKKKIEVKIKDYLTIRDDSENKLNTFDEMRNENGKKKTEILADIDARKKKTKTEKKEIEELINEVKQNLFLD